MYKVFIILIVAGALSGYIIWQKWQMQILANEVQRITTERDAALVSVNTLEQTLAIQAAQVEAIQQKMAQMGAERAENRAKVAYLKQLFGGHDLQNLMAKKPGIITKRMQNATDKVFTDLNAISQ